MEPTQAKPVKKRRRWLVVAMVLAIASFTSWWYWPRGDARFVGKWSMTMMAEKPFHFGDLQFRANGRGRTVFSKTYFPWRVENDDIVIGYQTDRGWPKRLSGLDKLITRWTGASVVPHEWRLKVTRVEPDRLHIRDGEKELLFDRVPE